MSANDQAKPNRGRGSATDGDTRLLHVFACLFILTVTLWGWYVARDDPAEVRPETIEELILGPSPEGEPASSEPNPLPRKSKPPVPPMPRHQQDNRAPQEPPPVSPASPASVPSSQVATDSPESLPIPSVANPVPSPSTSTPDALVPPPQRSLAEVLAAGTTHTRRSWLAPLKVGNDCRALPGRACLQIAVPLERRAFLLVFYATSDTLHMIGCRGRTTRQPSATYSYDLALLTNGTVKLLTFHALATRRAAVAQQLANHLRAAPGACEGAYGVEDWLSEHQRILASNADAVAHQAIHLVWRNGRFAIRG